jgi:hypothetical protein
MINKVIENSLFVIAVRISWAIPCTTIVYPSLCWHFQFYLFKPIWKWWNILLFIQLREVLQFLYYTSAGQGRCIVTSKLIVQYNLLWLQNWLFNIISYGVFTLPDVVHRTTECTLSLIYNSMSELCSYTRDRTQFPYQFTKLLCCIKL